MIKIYRWSADLKMSTHENENVKSALLEAVRELYSSIEIFDVVTAKRLGVDRSGLRAINAMEGSRLSPSWLGEALGLTSGSVTALLDRLERDGHIKRQSSDEDKRRRVATLTKSTRARADQHYAELGKRIQVAFGGLTKEDAEKVVETMKTLRACFDQEQRLKK